MLEAQERNLKCLHEQFEEEVKAAKIAQLHAEERLRRQTEISTTKTTELSVASQDIQEFALKQMKLQKWTEQSDDDEISQTMGTLFRKLEAWAKHHLPRSANGREFNWYSGHVSRRVFELWLSRPLVGFASEGLDDEAVSQAVQSLGRKVDQIGKHTPW